MGKPQPFRHLGTIKPRRQSDRALHAYNYLVAWVACGGDKVRVNGEWKQLTRPKIIPEGSPKRLFTYGDLVEAIGDSRQSGRSLAMPLGILARFCLNNGVPLINTLVVNHEDGRPGLGLISEGDKPLGQQQREALKFDWLNYRAPTSRTLKAIQDSEDED